MGGLSATPPSSNVQVEDCFAGFKNQGWVPGSCFTRNFVEYCDYGAIPWLCLVTILSGFEINDIGSQPTIRSAITLPVIRRNFIRHHAALLQGAGGMIVHPAEFLQRIRALCS